MCSNAGLKVALRRPVDVAILDELIVIADLLKIGLGGQDIVDRVGMVVTDIILNPARTPARTATAVHKQTGRWHR